MIITVYAKEPKIFSDSFLEVKNLVDIEVSEDVVFDWFKENVLQSFRPDVDEGVSDKGLFEEWLAEYTADDTVGLWDYAAYRADDPRIAEILM